MRKSLLQTRTKKAQKSRSEVYMINVKYLGEEPVAIESNVDTLKAFNWYHSMCDKADARQYLRDYFRADKSMLKTVDKISDSMMPYTAAWMCRIASNGARRLEPDDLQFVTKKIVEAVKTKLDEDTLKPRDARPSIQDRMRDRESEIIGDIEALIDSGEKFSMYEWLKSREIPATYASKIVGYYTPWLAELVEAYEGRDEQLAEAYGHWTKGQLKDRISQFGSMLSDVERYGNVTKKIRAPRKARAVSMDKLLKYFKFQKESNEYKLASVSPESVIGASELWTFNTKYKIVTVFRAIDRGGLQVKRSSITNYDEKTSFSRGAGRQVEKVIDKIQNSGKIALKKLMEELKSDKPLQERVNENTILVRVVK